VEGGGVVRDAADYQPDPADHDQREADHAELMALRDEIAEGLKVRAGAALDPMVILERANNIAARIQGGFYVRRRP
jgi:hypothetical protein